MTTIAKPKAWPDPSLFFRDMPPDRPGQSESRPADQPADQTEKAVRCRACRAVVTSVNREIAIHGNYLHTLFNPAGIVYEIRCFSQAPGCVNHGQPTDEFTWFAGYTWQYSLCAACLDHLGWFYTSSAGFFFGLIDSRLIVE